MTDGRTGRRCPHCQRTGDPRVLDMIAGTWGPYNKDWATSKEPDNSTTVTLWINSGGHYSLHYTLREKGSWRADKGTWTSQAPNPGDILLPDTVTGHYLFTGRNVLTLFDQYGSSTAWRRGS